MNKIITETTETEVTIIKRPLGGGSESPEVRYSPTKPSRFSSSDSLDLASRLRKRGETEKLDEMYKYDLPRIEEVKEVKDSFSTY